MFNSSLKSEIAGKRNTQVKYFKLAQFVSKSTFKFYHEKMMQGDLQIYKMHAFLLVLFYYYFFTFLTKKTIQTFGRVKKI